MTYAKTRNRREIQVDDRCFLSPLANSDRRRLVELLNEREIYDRTLRIPAPYTFDDADSFLKFVRGTESRMGCPTHFAIRENSGEMIGALGYEKLAIGHRVEIGYWLGKAYWGQGIMTNVIESACRFAIAEWHVVRIEAEVFDFNQASARVLAKNGFQLEGLLAKSVKKDDRFIDCKLFALVS